MDPEKINQEISNNTNKNPDKKKDYVSGNLEKSGGKVDNLNQGLGFNDFLNNGKDNVMYPWERQKGVPSKNKNFVQLPEIKDKKEDKKKQENKEKPSYKAVADIVKDMGYDWDKVKKELTIWATGEEYISAKENEDKNIKQNEAIREKLLEGNKLDLLGTSILKFSTEKQQQLKKLTGSNEFKSQNVSAYLGNLPNEKVKKLNDLPDEKFAGFLHEQLSMSEKRINNGLSKKENIDQHENREILIYQAANVLEVMQFDQRLDSYIKKNPSLEKTKEKAEKEAVVKYSKLDQEKKESLKAIYGTEEVVLKSMTINATINEINNSEEFKKLSPEEKQEFDAILVDVYRYNEKVSPELNEMYFPDMKSEIEQKEREINQISLNISESFSDSQKTVLENKEFNNYFKDHYIDEFVGKEQKDQSYRDNLQKIYPNSKNIIQASFSGVAYYQKCFDKDGNIDRKELESLPKDKQDIFSAKVKEKLNTVDEELVGNINNAVKEQSVETCLATLSKCMNIKFDDGTKEDMIKNFDFASQMNDNLVVDFGGTLNGKKISLSYNMVDGKVSYQEYLYKDKGTNTFKKSDSNVKTEMTFVELPKLEDFISASKTLDYAREMGDAKNIDDFHSSIKNKLNSQVQKNIDIKDARENFEKSMLQDIAMQEIFSFMGYGEDKNLSNIDPKEEPNLYKLYSMFYESICFYTRDELKSFRESIKNLNLQKSKISLDYNNLNVTGKQLENDLKSNEEKVFFDLLMTNSLSSKNKESENNPYLGFFECFVQESTNPPLSVIDLSKMKDYMGKLDKEINNDSENILEWKRNNIFKKNLGKVRDNYDVLAIEKNISSLL